MIAPGAWLGVLGGGQLGRMFAMAAHELGYRVMVLDPDPEGGAGAAADRHLCAPLDDPAALDEMARVCAAVTVETENAPTTALERLARDVVVSRLKQRGIHPKELRTDFIGLQSLHDSASNAGQWNGPEPYEVRLRVVGLCDNERDATLLGHEVETLLCSGPAGGAGDFKAVREIIAVLSILLPRNRVTPEVVVEGY